MITEISAILVSMNNAYSLLRVAGGAAIDTVTLAKINDAQQIVSDAFQRIVSFQGEAIRLQGENEALSKELEQINVFREKIADYDLVTFPTGAAVFVVKDGAYPLAPGHKICPNCATARRISYLQPVKADGKANTLKCHPCDATFELGLAPPPERIVYRHTPL